MFAAIGTDGIRDVVWGIGETPEAALEEAREGILQDGANGAIDLETREISTGDVEAVRAGEVAAERLGRR